MRTTISIDDDVMERARAITDKLGTPFKTVVNEALRNGLDRVEQQTKQHNYKTKPHKMGLRVGRNIDNNVLLRMCIKEIAQARVRNGYKRILILLCCEGWKVTSKAVYRIYRQEGLNLRHRKKKTDQ